MNQIVVFLIVLLFVCTGCQPCTCTISAIKPIFGLTTVPNYSGAGLVTTIHIEGKCE